MALTGSSSETGSRPSGKRAHIIVIGNEKGGSGKTTTCMHLITALLRLGFSVGSIDIDARQRSLTRYIENRRETIAKHGTALPLPHHIVVNKSPFNVQTEAHADERERLTKGLGRVMYSNDFVIIDGPGNDTFLSRLAHSYADTIITPINDSFVDLDVLATVDGETLKIIRPSIYSEMIWEQKLERAKRDGGTMEWIVMRNRLSAIDARNKRFMSKALGELAKRIGFRIAPGFGERVIFRELFLQGLTVLDVINTSTNVSITMSHIAARQEVRTLLSSLQLPQVEERMRRMDEANEKHKPASASKDGKAVLPGDAGRIPKSGGGTMVVQSGPIHPGREPAKPAVAAPSGPSPAGKSMASAQ